MAAKNGVINLTKFLGRAADPSASFMQSAVQYSSAGGAALYKLPELPYSYSALGEGGVADQSISTKCACCS